jgi:MFS transporter, MHS family, shikimate and dehydroshikimate transport protein
MDSALGLGSVIKWYDFYIFATARSPRLWTSVFPATDPFVATISSLLAVTVGLFARPAGSILFGHFGDRIGRKSMLLLTLFLMGIPTALIGMLPTYQSVGVWAPIMLVALRIIQGLAIGGEWGGALLQLGTPAGALLSVGAFALTTQMPEGEFVSWGRRIPFLASIALVAFGLAFVERSRSSRIHYGQARKQDSSRPNCRALQATGEVPPHSSRRSRSHS